MKIKFADFDFHKINSFLKIWKKVTGGTGASSGIVQQPDEQTVILPGPPEVPELTPYVGFSAALHAMVYIDDEAAAEDSWKRMLEFFAKHL